MRVSRPHVAFLGRIPGTDYYSDMDRHPENEPIPGVVAFRPEASVIYVNAESIFETVIAHVQAPAETPVKLVVCDLSVAPYMDLGGARMLDRLHGELATRGIPLRIVGAHGTTRDLLRAEAIDAKVGGVERVLTLDRVLRDATVWR